MLFPTNLSEILPKDHPPSVVSRVIDQLNLAPRIDAYSRQGASAYHPRMLLKLIVFAYLSNNCSSRKIAQQCRESAPFMGLSAMTKPDHNTIQRFRSDRLKHVLRHVFTKISLLLAENGLVSLNKNLFVDGTKIEANAKRYTFVWAQAIKTHKEKMQKQLDELRDYTQQVAKEELQAEPPAKMEAIPPSTL